MRRGRAHRRIVRAMKTFQDVHALRVKLDDAEKALEAAQHGASYSVGGRSVTRQQLTELRAERDRLRRELKHTQAYLEGVRDPSVAVATWN